jgi:hypothetical protein
MIGSGANKRQMVTGAVTKKITVVQEAAKTIHSIFTAIVNAIDQCHESHTGGDERLIALTNSIHYMTTTTPQPASGDESLPNRTYSDVVNVSNSRPTQKWGATMTNTAVTHESSTPRTRWPNSF